MRAGAELPRLARVTMRGAFPILALLACPAAAAFEPAAGGAAGSTDPAEQMVVLSRPDPDQSR